MCKFKKIAFSTMWLSQPTADHKHDGRQAWGSISQRKTDNGYMEVLPSCVLVSKVIKQICYVILCYNTCEHSAASSWKYPRRNSQYSRVVMTQWPWTPTQHGRPAIGHVMWRSFSLFDDTFWDSSQICTWQHRHVLYNLWQSYLPVSK